MIEKAVSSVSEYLGIIETLKKHYPARMTGNDPVSTHFLFRGLSNQSYKFLPRHLSNPNRYCRNS